MPGPSSSPPPKRIKRESTSPKAEIGDDFDLGPEIEVDEDHCTICLQPIADRAVIPACSHEFCFECLMIWSRKNPFILLRDSIFELDEKQSEQSRRCPLCAQATGDYLIHHIRSTHDYQKHFLPPLRTSPPPVSRTYGARIASMHRRRERVWGLRDRAAQDEVDALERAVGRRRWIYRHNLYAKASLPLTHCLLREQNSNPSLACRLEQVHTLPPLPHPCTVRGVTGPHQSDDRLSPARASRMAQRRRGGVHALFRPCLSPYPLISVYDPAVLGDLCDFPHESHRHSFGERYQVAR